MGFEYDWPPYAATSMLTIATPATILGRIQRVAVDRSSGSAALTSLPRVDASHGYPVALSQGIQLSRVECGYFDPGTFAKMESDIVQPACKYEVVHSRTLGTHVLRHGLGGAVPAAVTAVPDAKWPELQLLSSGGTAAAPGATAR
jgi:hypothetical protein